MVLLPAAEVAKYASDPLATTLGPFFAKANLPPATARAILDIVPCVSWSTEKRMREKGQWGAWHDTCAELHCVQDADRLDAIGAVGVMRCAAFSGAKNRILLAADTPSAESHFDEKLLHIKDRIKVNARRGRADETEHVAKEAARRQETMLVFLEALRKERDFAGRV